MQVSSVAMPLSQQPGYYCSVCDCVLKDSMSYLDHLNGKWHNRALGMSMRVEKSTAEQVRSRLEEIKNKKGSGQEADVDHVPDGLNRQVCWHVDAFGSFFA
jgi:U4/U6.U5 tri-snRNP component SNU23